MNDRRPRLARIGLHPSSASADGGPAVSAGRLRGHGSSSSGTGWPDAATTA